MKNFLKVLSYIIVIIICIPIAAIILYLGLGTIIFILGYIYYRKKYGKFIFDDETKKYKNTSTVILLLGIVILIALEQTNLLTIECWLLYNLVAFIGMLPLDYYLFKKIKEAKI